MGVMKQLTTAQREGQKQKGAGVDWNAAMGGSPSGGVSWNDADPVFVASVIYLATRAGMAVSFSATANNQAVSITFLDGPNRPKYYANTPAGLNELMRRLNDVVGG